MYWAGKLCVPEGLCLEVTAAFHKLWGHVGVRRMVQEMKRRVEFPSSMSVEKMVTKIKSGCQICQQTEPPNWQVSRKIQMAPIPDRIFSSVCLDIFSMPPEVWCGIGYDCMLVCVDRLSGWIVAKPTQNVVLTAEKAAHLMMDDGWNIFGVPETVTSDQGPQFAGTWWKTMCSRLGIGKTLAKHTGHNPTGEPRWQESK